MENTIQESLDEFNKFTEDYSDLKQKFSEKLKAQLHPLIVTKVFDKYPLLQGIGWTQYTPYFNDGDECVFSVHDASYIFDPEFEPSDEMYDNDLVVDYISVSAMKYLREGVEDNSTRVPELKQFISELSDVQVAEYLEQIHNDCEFLFTIPDEIMKLAFGDHVQVVVTRDGIHVSEYEHD